MPPILVSLIALILVLPGAVLAGAQQQSPRDYDCADFASQSDAQRVSNSIPGDPYRLDPDNDGIACEGLPLPSGNQVVAYVILAVALVVIASYAAAFLWQRRRRARSIEGRNLEERLSELQASLQAVASSVGEIENEVSTRRDAVERLERDAQRAVDLSRLSSGEVDAVKSALQEVVSQSDRRSFETNILIAVITSVVGIGGSILVSIFVP